MSDGAGGTNTTAPSKRPALDHESDTTGTPATAPAIKRRQVRAKKLRRHEHVGDEDDGSDRPDATDASAAAPDLHHDQYDSWSPGRGARGVTRSITSPASAGATLVANADAAEPGVRSTSRSRSGSMSRSPGGSGSGTHTHTRDPRAPRDGPKRGGPSAPPSDVARIGVGLGTTGAAGFPRSTLAPPRSAHPALTPCRSVYKYTRLNHIEEGTYGVVFRARCNDTGDIYALKKLKLDEEKHGFPITSLREIMALQTAGEHENVVGIREIVVGDTLNQIFIVMPFIEHDLKTLLADMPHAFLQSEVKTIMAQLLSAVAYCHSHWILHRDLKTSNLLMNNRGQIKVADFGLARKFGDPLGEMTQLVVTLWYRAPELLLGAKEYTTAIDMWSVGCIFAELIQRDPLFPGRGEIDQLNKIFHLLGRPNEDAWPGFSKLPNARSINPVGPTFSTLRQHFKLLSSEGHALMAALLWYDPERRISADDAGKHAYFTELPLPKHPDLFPSFPSVASGERRHKLLASPPPPVHVAKTDDKMDLESFV